MKGQRGRNKETEGERPGKKEEDERVNLGLVWEAMALPLSYTASPQIL